MSERKDLGLDPFFIFIFDYPNNLLCYQSFFFNILGSDIYVFVLFTIFLP